MSEDKIRSKALALVIILLAVALYNNYRMKQELNNLRSEMSSMEAVLRNEINGVRNDADHKYESVTKKMEQEAQPVFRYFHKYGDAGRKAGGDDAGGSQSAGEE